MPCHALVNQLAPCRHQYTHAAKLYSTSNTPTCWIILKEHKHALYSVPFHNDEAAGNLHSFSNKTKKYVTWTVNITCAKDLATYEVISYILVIRVGINDNGSTRLRRGWGFSQYKTHRSLLIGYIFTSLVGLIFINKIKPFRMVAIRNNLTKIFSSGMVKIKDFFSNLTFWISPHQLNIAKLICQKPDLNIIQALMLMLCIWYDAI